MTLPIVLSDQAVVDIANCRNWWAENRSLEQAEHWHAACENAIDLLSGRAARCPRPSEGGRLPIDARQLAFGLGRRPTHRVLFTIRPDMIYVLRVRSLSQDSLTVDDI